MSLHPDLLGRALRYLSDVVTSVIPEGSVRIPLYEHPRPGGFYASCSHRSPYSWGAVDVTVRMKPKLFRWLVSDTATGDWIVEHTVYVGACNVCGKRLHAMADEPTVRQVVSRDRQICRSGPADGVAVQVVIQV